MSVHRMCGRWEERSTEEGQPRHSPSFSLLPVVSQRILAGCRGGNMILILCSWGSESIPMCSKGTGVILTWLWGEEIHPIAQRRMWSFLALLWELRAKQIRPLTSPSHFSPILCPHFLFIIQSKSCWGKSHNYTQVRVLGRPFSSSSSSSSSAWDLVGTQGKLPSLELCYCLNGFRSGYLMCVAQGCNEAQLCSLACLIPW